MAWKEVSLKELALSLGVSYYEVREKQKLIETILKIRKNKKISQQALAKLIGVSQGRIAQIESGIGTHRVSFDVLLNALVALGYDYTVSARKAA